MRNTNADAVQIRNEQVLCDYDFTPVTSHVITSALTYTYTTTKNQIRLANYEPRACTPLLRVLTRVNYEMRAKPRDTIVAQLNTLRNTNEIFAKMCPTLTASTTPLLTTTVLTTSDTDDVRSIIFRQEFNYTRNFTTFKTTIRIRKHALSVQPIQRLRNTYTQTTSLHKNTTLIITTLTTEKQDHVASANCVSHKCTNFTRVLTRLNTRVRQRVPQRDTDRGGAPSGGRG